MKKYVVVGGQYNFRYYGESDSMIGAKRIATRNEEYWDNWQGWHVPSVYLSEDFRFDENGQLVPVEPERVVFPVAYRFHSDKRWTEQ